LRAASTSPCHSGEATGSCSRSEAHNHSIAWSRSLWSGAGFPRGIQGHSLTARVAGRLVALKRWRVGDTRALRGSSSPQDAETSTLAACAPRGVAARDASGIHPCRTVKA
jgi:hypothetical protein